MDNPHLVQKVEQIVKQKVACRKRVQYALIELTAKRLQTLRRVIIRSAWIA